MDRSTFMAAATRLHEFEVDSGALGIGNVWIRELTARQRLDALEGAYLRDTDGAVLTTSEGYNRYDDTLYRAFLLQSALIDGPGGALILTLEDVPEIAQKGRECLQRITTDILNLSWLTKEDLFRRHTEADDRQRDTGKGAGADAGGAEREGAPAAGIGSDVADGSGRDPEPAA
jgi:hypothetical protein